MQPETSADKTKAKNTRRTTCIWSTVARAGCLVPLLLLIAILYPVFEHGRGVSNSFACLTNVKFLAIAGEMYAEDYNGRLPPAPQWMDATFPYVKDYQVYSCPVVSENQPSQDAHSPVPKNAHFGYSFNPVYSCRKTGSFTNPTGAPLIYDSTYLFWNAAGPLNTLPNPGRHHGGNNIGFVNGHVHWFSISGSRKFIQPSKK